MSWAFLTVSVVGLWLSVNAPRPRKWPGFVALGSFFAGWLTSELAIQHLVWQVIATVVFIALGALGEWPGWLGLGLTLASWFGLLQCHRQSMSARATLLTAMEGGFEGHNPSDLRFSLEWKRILKVFPIRRPGVEKVRGIQFSKDHPKRLKLDVYRRSDKPENCPTLLYIHGGGWVIGNKDQQGLVTVNRLAAAGWVCFNANYRLSPGATFPDHIIDVKRAIAWVKEHGREYGANPDFLILAGGSAGAHLSSPATLTPNLPVYQPGFESVDTSITACVPYYGIYDFTDQHGKWMHPGFQFLIERIVMKRAKKDFEDDYELASPLRQISESPPPFFLLHGQKDTLAPPREARRFAATLREAGGIAVHAELPGAQHAFEIFPSVRSNLTVQAVQFFCESLYSDYLSDRETEASEEAAIASPVQAQSTAQAETTASV